MIVQIWNRQRRVACEVGRLREFVGRARPECLAEVGPGQAVLGELATLEVSLVGEAAMCRVHRRFFADPSPTDVITFPHGEILLGVERIAENAREFGELFERELQRCLLHGLLHLQGYEDGTAAKRKVMFARQEKLLRKLFRP
jgi:probable rRNA maturation factor